MTIENNDTAMSSEELLAMILFLMTRYCLNPEITVARMIESYLSTLANHPENTDRLIKEISMTLHHKWQSISNHQEFNLTIAQ